MSFIRLSRFFVATFLLLSITLSTFNTSYATVAVGAPAELNHSELKKLLTNKVFTQINTHYESIKATDGTNKMVALNGSKMFVATKKNSAGTWSKGNIKFGKLYTGYIKLNTERKTKKGDYHESYKIYFRSGSLKGSYRHGSVLEKLALPRNS